MSDAQAFARFEDHWAPTGEIGKDGLPKYTHVLKIRLSKPPLLDVREEATPEYIEIYAEAYKLYLKLRTAREIENIEGYPLALWPAITTAEFEQCAGHGIITVEQLAKYAKTGKTATAKMPEVIVQLALRAKRMIELQGHTGQFEAIIDQLRAERDELVAQLREANTQLSAANALVMQFQSRIAGIGTMLPDRVAVS